MKTFEITNPSDAYTLEAEEFSVACVATLLLGEGAWGLIEIDGDLQMPLFLFGGVDDWFREQFGKSFPELLHSTPPDQLAAVLESVLIGDKDDRATYNAGLALIESPENRIAWRDRWHEQRRSSMNNIGARAWRIAEVLRKEAAEQPGETQEG